MKDKSYIYELTPTEEEVYKMILQGYGQTQITRMRKKHVGTIKAQMQAIFEKYGVHSVKELREYESEVNNEN